MPHDDIFELLGLEPSSTYEVVNAARKKRMVELHPDKNGDKPDDIKNALEEEFKALNEQWEKVATQELFNAYVQQNYPGVYPGHAAASSSSPQTETNNSPSGDRQQYADKFKAQMPAPGMTASHGFKTVYFPLPFTFCDDQQQTRLRKHAKIYGICLNSTTAVNSQRAFLCEISRNHLEDIVLLINKLLKNDNIQVGRDKKQAIAIATQHSFTRLHFVVAVEVTNGDLSELNLTEKHMASAQLNAKTKIESLWMRSNVSITSDQIKMIFPPLEPEQCGIGQTMRTEQLTPEEKKWVHAEGGSNKPSIALAGRNEVLARHTSGAFHLTAAEGTTLPPIMLMEHDVRILKELYKTFRSNSVKNRLFTSNVDRLFVDNAVLPGESLLEKLLVHAIKNPTGASARTLEMYGLMGNDRIMLRPLTAPALEGSEARRETQTLMP